MEHLDILDPDLLNYLPPRVRSVRPLAHECEQISIKDLREKRLLRPGVTRSVEWGDGLVLTTNLVGQRPYCRINLGTKALTFPLVSRPLGRSLSWYFREPAGKGLVRTIYFSEAGVGSRQALGVLYASQLQPRLYARMLQMNRLVLAIDGDHYGRKGPARASSREEKLSRLRTIYAEVCAADEKREALFAKFPDFEKTYRFATELLKKETRKTRKG